MDEGPFRMPRQADRSASDEPPAPVNRPAEQTKRAHEEPKPVHRTSTPHRTLDEKKPNKKLFIGIAAAIAVLVIGAIIFSIVAGASKSGMAIDSGKYQAVFFTNGQVYFGKLQQFNDDYMKLKDVYYLQTDASDQQSNSKNPQQSSTDQNSTKLIKLGEEIHGPEDEMIISKDQVLFYENLKTDGKVSKSIEKFKNPN